MASSFTKLNRILTKSSVSRTPEDIREIGTYISNIKFFASFKENKTVFNECCAYITYEYF